MVYIFQKKKEYGLDRSFLWDRYVVTLRTESISVVRVFSVFISVCSSHTGLIDSCDDYSTSYRAAHQRSASDELSVLDPVRHCVVRCSTSNQSIQMKKKKFPEEQNHRQVLVVTFVSFRQRSRQKTNHSQFLFYLTEIMAKSIRSKCKRKARAEFRRTIGDVCEYYVLR